MRVLGVFFHSLWFLMDRGSKERDDLYNPHQPGRGIHFHARNAGGWKAEAAAHGSSGWAEDVSACRTGSTCGVISTKSRQFCTCIDLHHMARLGGGVRWKITSAGGNLCNCMLFCNHSVEVLKTRSVWRVFKAVVTSLRFSAHSVP